jgi:formate-dependent nitrite reductase membrane component NrfD
VQAIVSGDMDDPTTKIARLIATEETVVRKPEAGTKPKLHYIDVNESSLVPTDQTHAAGYLWAELRMDPVLQNEQALAEAEARARTTYDVSHERPWGWKVSAYLWTKSVSAGAFLIAALAIGMGFARSDWLFASVAPQISLLFLAATLALLVLDLKRPERFLRILLWPQWKSWLVIGGYILAVYGGVLAAWVASQLLDLRAMEIPLLVLGAIFAALSAVYSAFLFRQARGRVFWQSRLTALHLLVQAIVAGSAALWLFALLDTAVTGTPSFGPGLEFLYYELLGGIVAHGALVAGEVFAPEESTEKRRAARLISRGIFKNYFWFGVVVAGVILPLIGLATGLAQTPAIAVMVSLLALAGLFLWEHIWVQAGQAVPLS